MIDFVSSSQLPGGEGTAAEVHWDGADWASVSSPVWEQLRVAAIEAASRAYAPYSNYHVGAAALLSDGRVVTGCNVENAALGVTLCAECGLVSDLVNGGGGTIVAFTCVNGHGDTISPCGRCRQLLFEHSTAHTLLQMPAGVMTMDQVLPGAFGPTNLEEGVGTL